MLKEMTLEELETLSYTKIAQMYLEENKKTMTTNELFKEVCKLLQMTDDEYEDNIADFFQSLSTTKDFILIDGKWDLKINHKIKINIDEIYEEKDDIEEDTEQEELDELEQEEIEEDNYSDNDDDFIDDDLGELSIVDEEELEKDE